MGTGGKNSLWSEESVLQEREQEDFWVLGRKAMCIEKRVPYSSKNFKENGYWGERGFI